jgi:hypothetical protein
MRRRGRASLGREGGAGRPPTASIDDEEAMQQSTHMEAPAKQKRIARPAEQGPSLRMRHVHVLVVHFVRVCVVVGRCCAVGNRRRMIKNQARSEEAPTSWA